MKREDNRREEKRRGAGEGRGYLVLGWAFRSFWKHSPLPVCVMCGWWQLRFITENGKNLLQVAVGSLGAV